MKYFLSLFSKENSVRGASLLLIVTLTLSNVLGLLRDHFLARNLPFSQLDVYFASFRIPDTIFNLLILGAISSAFIPIFSDFLAKKHDKQGFLVANTVITLAIIVMSVSAVALYFAMPMVVKWVAPNFTEARYEQTVQLSRLLMLTPIIFSISYVASGMLNSYKRFFAYALAPLMYNISIIAGTIVAAPRYGLIGVGAFVVFGALLHLCIQVPALWSVGFRYRPTLDLKNESVKRIGRLMIPRSISLGTNQILLTVYTAIASSLAVGAIAAYNYSNNIQTVPIVILANSFATAVFPTLASKIAEGNKTDFVFYFNRTARTIAFLLIPSTVIFILLRYQIISLVLTGTKVSEAEKVLTATTLGFFAISFLAQGLIPVFARAFFALKNTRLPMYASIAATFLSIIAGYVFSENYSVAGLALAFSVGSYIHLYILYLFLQRKYADICATALFVSMGKIVLTSILMGLFVWLSVEITSTYFSTTSLIGTLSQISISCIIGALTYLGFSFILGIEEMGWAFRRRINGKSSGSLGEAEVS